MRWLYSLFFFILLPVVLLRLWWRGRKSPGYRLRWRERFAILPPLRKGGIWVHAVSVGETIAAIPLVEALTEKYPSIPITITSMTPTGSERVRAAFGDRVQHVYVPYDLPFLVQRFLRATSPRLCLIMETELWPNLIAGCVRNGVPIIVANARLSKRSARGYFKARCLSVPMLRGLTHIAAQERADARRFIALGVNRQNISVTGTIKSDVQISAQWREESAVLRNALGQRFRVIAASTHEGEDEHVLAAFIQLRKNLSNAQLILVPRHPERFDKVTNLAQASTLTVRRRSAGSYDANTDILIGDTMGELMMLYGACDAVFVGGSLVARGGHNPLEPLAWSLPVAQGPHTFNFESLSKKAYKNKAITPVNNADELARFWLSMSNEKERHAMGQTAALFLSQNSGALQKLLNVISSAFTPR